MKKRLLLFAALLLPWMVKAQSIEVSNDTLSFEYAEGHGPAIKSFEVFPNELNADMVISFKKLFNLHYHISKTEDNGYEDSISFTIDELEELGNTILIFVRMDENLGVNTYKNTIIIRSDGDTLGQVQCTGIVNGAVAIPQFTLPEETYHGQQTVSINCDTEGATIYYTTNGEDPDDSSAIYELNEEILIDRTTTLKAVGIKENWNNSDFASATYHIQYHIRADVSPEESGNIIYNGQYWAYIDNDIDTNVDCITLQASPRPNYSFEYWKDNNGAVVSTPQYVIPVDRDYSLTAEFKKNNGNINYSVFPPGAGNVIIGGSQEIGQTATLTAIPEHCYHFKQWNDESTDNPLEFTVGENNYYIAIFELNNYSILGISNNEEWGSVTGGGNHFHCEDVATLKAIPEEGYEFDKWDDGNSDNPRQVVVNGDASYTAEFAAKKTNIIVIANPSDGGVVTGAGIYSSLDSCTVTAQAYEGFSFKFWTEDHDSISTNEVYTFKIEPPLGTNERILEAIFSPIIKEPNPICSGDSLTLENPLILIGGEWQLSSDFDFGNFIPYDNQPLDASYNGWYLRYHYQWYSLEWDSNIVQITVNSLAELSLKGDESVERNQEVKYWIVIEGETDFSNYSIIWIVSDEQAVTTITEDSCKVIWKTTNEQQISVIVTDNRIGCSDTLTKPVTVSACIDDLQTIQPKKHTEGHDTYVLILVYPNPNDVAYEYQWRYSTDGENYRDLTDGTYNKQYYYKGGRIKEGYYKVRVSNDRCSEETEPYHVDGSRLRLYPNPSYRGSNIAIEKGCDGQALLNIYSTDGRLLHTQTVTDNQATIGISLPQGVFVAYLTDSEGYTKVCKLIIQ